MEGDFVGEGGVAGSFSSTGVRITFGESSMTLGSFKLVPRGFGMSKKTFFNFLLDEVIAAIASLNIRWEPHLSFCSSIYFKLLLTSGCFTQSFRPNGLTTPPIADSTYFLSTMGFITRRTVSIVVLR